MLKLTIYPIWPYIRGPYNRYLLYSCLKRFSLESVSDTVSLQWVNDGWSSIDLEEYGPHASPHRPRPLLMTLLQSHPGTHLTLHSEKLISVNCCGIRGNICLISILHTWIFSLIHKSPLMMMTLSEEKKMRQMENIWCIKNVAVKKGKFRKAAEPSKVMLAV